MRGRLQQFKDGFGSFKDEHALAVARSPGLGDIPYVREKVAGNGAK
jgi:hypothetical protein